MCTWSQAFSTSDGLPACRAHVHWEHTRMGGRMHTGHAGGHRHAGHLEQAQGRVEPRGVQLCAGLRREHGHRGGDEHMGSGAHHHMCVPSYRMCVPSYRMGTHCITPIISHGNTLHRITCHQLYRDLLLDTTPICVWARCDPLGPLAPLGMLYASLARLNRLVVGLSHPHTCTHM